MPQKTNLNISPYYDDFDKNDNFYKVLFKPGQPVQARELTTLQSVLQNQVESVGSHLFKDGSMVIPGSINYDDQYYSIKINENHLGVPVALYCDELIGKNFKGQTSGIVVTVNNYSLPAEGTNITDLTLFVSYKEAGDDKEVAFLGDGEVLISEESFVYGNTPVTSGSTVATLISLNAAATGCAVSISDGVFFSRGTFIDVSADVIILDPYTNTPSYRVGLNLLEEIVTAKDDSSLYDNARGFSNYAAPGADRLKISAVLSKKSLTDFDDKSFIELVKLDNGLVKKLQNKTEYSIIADEFARRTFEESGDYSLDAFDVRVAESLNDGISNEGVFSSNRVTDDGNTPSDELMCVKVSPGEAYVRGYEVDSLGRIVDVEKPRDTQSVGNALVPFQMGNLLKVNFVEGSPKLGINHNNKVYLYNRRKTSSNPSAGSGVPIGEARVYSFSVSDAPYQNDGTEWDLYLYDINIFTTVYVNHSISLVVSDYVRGLSSGATGYVKDTSVGVDGFNLTQVSGQFIVGEELIFNEDPASIRTVKRVQIYGIQDIKSVHQNTGGSGGIFGSNYSDFTADTVLRNTGTPAGFNVGDQLTITSGGVATSPGKNFLGIRSDATIAYQIAGFSTVTYNRVNHISSDGLTLSLVSGGMHVPNVASNTLPSGTVTVPFSIVNPNITNSENAGLYTPLDTANISDVDLNNSSLSIRSQIINESTSGSGEMVIPISSTGLSSSFYDTFDAERYSMHFSNATIENLTSDQFELNANGTQVTIKGATASQTNVIVNTTVKKQGIRSKQKDFIRSEKLIVNKGKSGSESVVSGLTVSNFYGTRVHDKEVCLNVPDVVNVVGVYESLTTSDPSLDKLTFVGGLGLNTNSIVGERIVGARSSAVAQLTTRSSATEVEICYLNDKKFIIGESITFEESQIISNLQGITVGSYLDVSDKFDLDKGQREQYYDYSRLVRKSNFAAPSRKLLVVYDCYQVPSNDNGDVYTVESYSKERFGKDIPHLKNGVRATDVLDFRPRVATFTSTSSSPFAPSSRDFSGSVNPPVLAAPNESSILGYTYYLPRKDKLVLRPGPTKEGTFSVVKGISALDPKEPTNVESVMHIADIILPAYLYDADDAVVHLQDNRRYTMRDIGSLEDRIENLEVVTSLSLLELDTKTLQVQDSDGLSRFKSGFFVDDFKDNNLVDILNPDCNVDIDTKKKECNVPLDFTTVAPELALLPTIDTTTADFSTNIELLDSNIQKTGDLLTLKYSNTDFIEQPLASRVENVNPFNMIEYNGHINLDPMSDGWIRNVYVSGGERTITGGRNYEYIETIKISSHPDTHIRSRNVAFEGDAFRPVARLYPFFDGVSGIDIVPKLLEINMTRGVFQKGETVEVHVGGTKIASLRLAQPNHKTGDWNSPTTTFNANPYNTSISLPTAYAASSTVLNIDEQALAEEAQGSFWGYVQTGAVVLGTSSGAEASVSDVRLVSDTYGDVYGAFWFKDPLGTPVPSLRFRTGTKTFKLTSSDTNAEPLPGSLLISSGETWYRTEGTVDTYRQTNIIVRQPPPPPPRRCDPLAQSFTTDTDSGCFLTAVDLFFASKDASQRCFVEIRTVELGTPTGSLVQDFARVSLQPSEINISDDATVATTVTFPSPVYLEPDTEYAVVVLSPFSNNYEAWIARMGERTVNTTTLPDAESVMVTRQYIGGSLFKSQNGTIWTPSQFEDLKFKLHKANFTSSSGTVYFYNPSLGPDNNHVPKLLPNSVTTLPRKLRIGITTTSNMGGALIAGRRITSADPSAALVKDDPSGYIENVGSRVTTLVTSQVGSGYKASQTYTNTVELYPITGQGSGAKATVVTTSSGVINGVTIAAGFRGNGYVVGDALGITTSTTDGQGSGAVFTVSAIDNIDTLYLTNVQGENFTPGNLLLTYDSNNTTITNPGLAATAIRTAANTHAYSDLYDGNILEVNQINHGMTADNNVISISGINPDTSPVLLTDNISATDTVIAIASTAEFATYNGITTAMGYAKINGEIVKYEGIGINQLTAITRGIDGTLSRTHSVNDPAYKYELAGIGLTAINTTHNMPTTSSISDGTRTIDRYHLRINRPGGQTSGHDMTNFIDMKSVGGGNAFASQNFQYNAILPQVNVITPGDGTFVSSQLRSVSGTSAGGSEISFLDQGYEDIELNQLNDLTSSRLVCSEINETTRLTTLPKNRSTTLAIRFNSENANLSPVVDTQNAQIILRRNRLSNPIVNYSRDDRVNQLTGDPHTGIYISNRINLQQPASSIKVLIGADRHSSADFRVLYQLFSADSDEPTSYNLFPGYDNLRDTDGDGYGDEVIDSSKNSGLPDAMVSGSVSGQFKEYQFTIDNLPQFNGFAIKIVCSGTNEAYPPKFKDLRVVALA